jgi:hypothetical protein
MDFQKAFQKSLPAQTTFQSGDYNYASHTPHAGSRRVGLPIPKISYL